MFLFCSKETKELDASSTMVKKNILYAIMRFVVIRVNTSKGKKKTMRKKIICWIMCNQKFKIVRSCNGCRFEFRNVSPPGSEFGNCYQVECPRGDCYLSLAGGWVWRQSSGGSSLDGPRQSARLDVCKSRSPFSQDWRVLFTILTVQVCISFIQRINNSSIQKVKNVLFVVNKCFVLLFFFKHLF